MAVSLLSNFCPSRGDLPQSFGKIVESERVSFFQEGVLQTHNKKIGKKIRETTWFEIAHPLHPKPGSTKRHQEVWRDLGSPGSFEEYLDSIGFIYADRIVFFSDEQIHSYECSIHVDESGRCYLIQQERCLADGVYLFVLSMEGVLYALQEECFAEGEINYYYKHTSITHGEPVLSVGEITVSNGFLSEIAMKSGHYYPKEEEEAQFLSFLQDYGIDVSAIELHPIPSNH